MALKKDIELGNGINLNYHRIVSLNIITNNSILIEVASYINQTQREKEKEVFKTGNWQDIYIKTSYYKMNYDEETSIKSAYEYLKTLPEFENVENT